MKHLFLLFTCAVISLQSATERSASPSSSPCDRVYFPNYFKWVGNDDDALRLVNQSIASVLKQLKISHFNGDVYTNRDFFEHINDVVQEKAPGAKVYISGGVVRSILGYIYKKMYNQAEREGHIEGSQDLVLDVFNRIIGAKSRKYDPTLAELPEYDGKKDKDLIPLDALGIGSDYDILIEFPESFTGHKQAVLNDVKAFIDQTGKNFGIQDDRSGLTRMIIPVGDVREYKAHVEDDAAQEGGSLLDLLAYPVTGGEIREPKNYAGKDQYPSIMESFFMGQANYVSGIKPPHNPTKQTIRGLRPLLEIPFLKVDEASQSVMIEELNRIQRLDDASQLQLDKMTRNARFQGAHNRFGIDCTQDGALSVAIKDLAKRLGKANFIPEFADKGSIKPTVQDQELETLLTPMDVFIVQYTAKDEAGNPTGVLYHGTPKIDNFLSMLRSGLIISRPAEEQKKGQGAALYGRGVYTTPDLSTAEGYANKIGKNGIVIPLKVNTHKPFRILDVTKQDVQKWLSDHPIYNNNWEALYRNYGIDIVIMNCGGFACPLIQNQEVVSIPKDIPFLIQRMQQSVLNTIRNNISLRGKSDKFLKLFDPNKGYVRLLNSLYPRIDMSPIIIDAALEGLKNQDTDIQKAALKLFESLLERGQGYKEAINAASAGLKNADFNIQNASLSLFKALVKKEQGYNEAIKAASVETNSPYFYVRSSAFQLFKALVEKGQGYQEAIDAASEGFKCVNEIIKENALQLFKALVIKEFEPAYQPAIDAALEGLKNEDTDIQKAALYLLKALVEKGQGYQQAIKAASVGMKSNDTDIQNVAINLFKSLFKKGEGYEKAIKTIVKEMTHNHRDEQNVVLEIFMFLFEKGQGYKEAIIAASEGIKSHNWQIQNTALQLFKALVEKEQGYDEAIDAASEGFQSINNIQESALQLFITLFKKEQGFKEALSLAIRGMDIQYWFIQSKSLQLFKALIENGFEPAYQPALIAASKGVKSSKTELSARQLIQTLEEKKIFTRYIMPITEEPKENFLGY
jgi:hypothetical protein